MKIINVDELKIIQLEILKQIHDFCVSNNIQYSLAYGTLLGAIRHKGYIPWDDDIDIMMTRPNYDKFMRSFRHNYLTAKCWECDNSFPLNYGKVYDTRTVLQEQMSISWENAIFVDVFCIDGIGIDYNKAKKFCKKIKHIHHFAIVKQLVVSKSRSVLKNLQLIALKTILMFFPYKRIIRYLVKLNKKHGFDNSKYVSDLSWGDPNLVFEKGIFSDYNTIEFESHSFLCISKPDVFLKAAYGDYMKLPPEDKRCTHHSFKAWWK